VNDTLRGSLGTLRGVGPKHQAQLEKLGLLTLEDALTFFPRDYEDRRENQTIFGLADGVGAFIRAMVAAEPQVARLPGGRTMTRVRVFDATGILNLTFFNNPYVKGRLTVGREYDFWGRAETRGAFRSMVNPLFDAAGAGRIVGRIVPIYRRTEGVSQALLMSVTDQALELARGHYREPLPPELVGKYRLWPPERAYEGIHRPQTPEDVRQARRRLIFEELLSFCCALQFLRAGEHGESGQKLTPCDPEAFFSALPFAPTGAQRRAVAEAYADMCSGQRMNRLLQGDVGSGKTLVAAACAYLAARSGRQSVIMAPTELLARQHARTLTQMLGPHGLSVGLLVGSLTAAQKRAVKETAAAGGYAVLCGTHALLQGDVAVPEAALFVVDEQHRFGVRQRAALGQKTQDAHLLVMSATPIPRTLTLILYGDLEISVLDELPPGRQRIETFVVGESKRARMYAFLKKEVAAGGQAYIVCPRVGEEDDPGEEKKAAVAYCAALQKALPSLRIGLLHGRMKGAEKDRVMAAFAAGGLDVLVSTTVIEVGVDVPNATLMVVENAELFGLSQLHQLRGRVGRGTRQSYCILMSGDPSETAKQRLSTLERTSDGFEIAREDLRLRGPGDFFGDRQHGLPAFRIADLAGDMGILETAQQEARALLARDPQLETCPLLRERVGAVIDKTLANALN